MLLYQHPGWVAVQEVTSTVHCIRRAHVLHQQTTAAAGLC